MKCCYKFRETLVYKVRIRIMPSFQFMRNFLLCVTAILWTSNELTEVREKGSFVR